jgi:hypothetical protein
MELLKEASLSCHISGISLPLCEMISQPFGCEKSFGISILAKKASLTLEGDHKPSYPPYQMVLPIPTIV